MKLAVIGCGKQGRAFGSAAADLGHEIVWCADLVEAAATKLARACSAKVMADPRRALQRRDIDGVIVVSPSHTHADYAEHAARAGHSVLCVAPFALDPAEARSAAAAFRKSRTVLYCAYEYRVLPSHYIFQGRIDDGSLGPAGFVRVTRADPMPKGRGNWHRDITQSGGVTGDSLSHEIAWIAAAFGPVASVYGQSFHRRRIASSLLTLTLKSGPIVQLVGSWSTEQGPAPRRTAEVCFREGMVRSDTDDLVLAYGDRDGNGTSSPLTTDSATRHLAHFQQAVDRGWSSKALRQEVHVAQVLDAARRSAATRKAVRIRS